ncbi:helix-turn-helix domain-containing protein [Streptobacillus moniliformis]|uniref:helix-turn-helix domain-containing protein n=1 Tax=Streptobacillus moniliformis TaxID=34105 RepID=UPI0007E46BD5|nr:helix-turn-helix transcriptional regulator [Streptobacillus moniliformis]
MNLEKIKKRIDEKGIKQKYIANLLGISENALSRKLNGKNMFTVEEIKIISNILRLNDREKIEFFLH